MSSHGITFNVRLPVTIKQRTKWYVASCPVLDVFSQGTTLEEAKANLVEALELFLMSCFERGTLDRVLKQCGFMPAYDAIAMTSPREEYLDIPLHMLVNTGTGQPCHA